jgi:hypothetical protein
VRLNVALHKDKSMKSDVYHFVEIYDIGESPGTARRELNGEKPDDPATSSLCADCGKGGNAAAASHEKLN